MKQIKKKKSFKLFSMKFSILVCPTLITTTIIMVFFFFFLRKWFSNLMTVVGLFMYWAGVLLSYYGLMILG